MKNVKKYKLVNGNGWVDFKEGEVYDGDDFRTGRYDVEFYATKGYCTSDWEEVVEKVKKFKFLGDLNIGEDGSYGGLIIGNIYNFTDECPISEGSSGDYDFVKFYIETYPNDWEEVTEELVEQPFKKFKFVGSYQEAGKYAYPVRVGMVYPDDYFKNIDSDVDLISEFTWSASEWEEVTEEFVRSPKIFTDAEVVTLVTFLNDNFEDFEDFIYGEEDSEFPTLDIDCFRELKVGSGVRQKACRIIDKIENNDTPLTEAEKVTIITFLNDNFEDFYNFIDFNFYHGGLSVVFYDELDGDHTQKASSLIDKIEKS